jgi:hypothetical protein
VAAVVRRRRRRRRMMMMTTTTYPAVDLDGEEDHGELGVAVGVLEGGLEPAPIAEERLRPVRGRPLVEHRPAWEKTAAPVTYRWKARGVISLSRLR